MESGMLAEHLVLNKSVFDPLLAYWLAKGLVVKRFDRLAMPSHSQSCDPALAMLFRKVEDAFFKNLFAPPSLEELAAATKLPPLQLNQAIRTLTEQKKLCRVEGQLYFHCEAVEQARRRIAEHIRGQGAGRLESVAFKYLVDTTRKFAIPLLDYMDRIGFTRRVGNTRYLK